jgi:hypothetical protein
MRVVISHFFNEEYMLPWWLKHHREIFDHGVLIDYRSTDRSVEICRELVPTWEIVTSENLKFAAILCDFEVMKHEQRFADAWKIALNTTEFLIAPQLAEIEGILAGNEITGCRMAGAIMVDAAPEAAASPDGPLVLQKQTGIWEQGFDFAAANIEGLIKPTRSRLYHRYPIGAYFPGRHMTHLPGIVDLQPQAGAVWWYAYSPWSDAFRNRKLQINATRDPFDKRFQMGLHHEADLARIEAQHARLLPFATALA